MWGDERRGEERRGEERRGEERRGEERRGEERRGEERRGEERRGEERRGEERRGEERRGEERRGEYIHLLSRKSSSAFSISQLSMYMSCDSWGMPGDVELWPLDVGGSRLNGRVYTYERIRYQYVRHLTSSYLNRPD